jgi:hypothetical protein
MQSDPKTSALSQKSFQLSKRMRQPSHDSQDPASCDALGRAVVEMLFGKLCIPSWCVKPHEHRVSNFIMKAKG